MISQGSKARIRGFKHFAPGSFPPTRENALRQLRLGQPRFMVRPPARAVRHQPGVGASPSGKAVDFDSTMRRFESSRPSHAFSLISPTTGLRRKARVFGGILPICASPGHAETENRTFAVDFRPWSPVAKFKCPEFLIGHRGDWFDSRRDRFDFVDLLGFRPPKMEGK